MFSVSCVCWFSVLVPRVDCTNSERKQGTSHKPTDYFCVTGGLHKWEKVGHQPQAYWPFLCHRWIAQNNVRKQGTSHKPTDHLVPWVDCTKHRESREPTSLLTISASWVDCTKQCEKAGHQPQAYWPFRCHGWTAQNSERKQGTSHKPTDHFSATGGLHKTVRESRAPATSLLTISVPRVDCTKQWEKAGHQPQAYWPFRCHGWTAQNSERKQGTSHKPTDHFGATGGLHKTVRESRAPATSLLTISVPRVDCTKQWEKAGHQPQAYWPFRCHGWTAQNSERKQGTSHKPTDHFGATGGLHKTQRKQGTSYKPTDHFGATGGLHKTVRESRAPATSLLTISVPRVDCTKQWEKAGHQPQAYWPFRCHGWTAQNSERKQGTSYKPTDHFGATGGLHKTVRESRAPATSLLTISVPRVDCTKQWEKAGHQPQAYWPFRCHGWTAQNSERKQGTSHKPTDHFGATGGLHKTQRKQGTSHKPTDHFGAQLSFEELFVAGRKGRLAQVATGLSHGQGQAVLHHKLQQRPEGEKKVWTSVAC